MQANAYAQYTDIHLATGQEKHLSHEAWHVVQQKQSRVKPTMQMKGKVNVNDDAGLDKESDLMGEKGTEMKSNEKEGFGIVDNRPNIIQCKREGKEGEAKEKEKQLINNKSAVQQEDIDRANAKVKDTAEDAYTKGLSSEKELEKGDDSTIKGYYARVFNDAVNDARRKAAAAKGNGNSESSNVVRDTHSGRSGSASQQLIKNLAEKYAQERVSRAISVNPDIQKEVAQLKDDSKSSK